MAKPTKKGLNVPWTLLLIVAGLILRFGVDGYNLLGDIFIGIGIGLTVLVWLLFILFASVATSATRRRW